MKKRIVALVSIFALCGCRNVQYNPHKNFQYDDFVNYYAEENKTLGKVDVCAVGDSITYHYDLESYYKGIKMVNRGIPGETTTGLLNHIDTSIFAVDMKVITLWIGINNVENMMNDYEYILSGIKEYKPDAKTIIISITPTRDYPSYLNGTIVERNKDIKALAEKYAYQYVDIHSKLLNPSNELNEKYSMKDGLHLSKEGYKQVTKYLKPVLNEALKS